MTSSSRNRARIALGLAVAAVALAGEAHAQPKSAGDIESARQAYNEGIALRDKGDTKGALEKFRAAHALGNTPITGLELCRTYAVLGQPVEARETCLSVARIPPGPSETPRSQEARTEAGRFADEVKSKIALLRLVVTGVPPGREATVTVDGFAVPAAALGQARAVNPGVHVVVAKVGQGGETRATFEAREGVSQDIELAVQPPPPDEPPPPIPGNTGPVAPPPPPEKKSSGLATFGYVTGGIGLGIGLIAGGVALAKRGDLEDACPDQKCGRENHDSLDSARAWGTFATVSFVVGGLGLGLGLLGSATSGGSTKASQGPTVKPVVGLGSAGLHGTF